MSVGRARPSLRLPRVMYQTGQLRQWKLSIGESPQYSVGRGRADKMGLEV